MMGAQLLTRWLFWLAIYAGVCIFASWLLGVTARRNAEILSHIIIAVASLLSIVCAGVVFWPWVSKSNAGRSAAIGGTIATAAVFLGVGFLLTIRF